MSVVNTLDSITDTAACYTTQRRNGKQIGKTFITMINFFVVVKVNHLVNDGGNADSEDEGRGYTTKLGACLSFH